MPNEHSAVAYSLFSDVNSIPEGDIYAFYVLNYVENLKVVDGGFIFLTFSKF